MRRHPFYRAVAMIGLACGFLLAATRLHSRGAAPGLTVRLENDRVRVLELRLKPGEEEGFHTHPQYLLYALNDYRVKNTAADGTSAIFDRKAGDLVWGEPITHRGENVGTSEVHALIVEIKPPGK